MPPRPISPTPILAPSIPYPTVLHRMNLPWQYGDALRTRRADDIGLFIADLLTGLCPGVELDVDHHARLHLALRVIIKPLLFRLQTDVVPNMVEAAKLLEAVPGIEIQRK